MTNPLSGIVLLDKPLGISSHFALKKVKRLFQAQKAGHTGSLDLLASGVLPICLGEATKFSQYLLDADKTYIVEGVLGERRSTGDLEGEVIQSCATAHITPAHLTDAITALVGEIEQIPPMYSAVKQKGKPLYKLARKGIEVERAARKITIYRIDIDEIALPRFSLTVHCSKGTYIRTLIEQIGEKLENCAYVSMLRRTKTGPFPIASSYTFSQLEGISSDGLHELVLPMDSALKKMPSIYVNAEQAILLLQGQKIAMTSQTFRDKESSLVRVFREDQVFIGLSHIIDQHIIPKRMVNRP